MTRDLDGGVQALAIVPVVEGGEAVTAGIRRGKQPDAGFPHPVDDRSNVKIGADAKRPRREFHEERRPGMLVMAADPAESYGFHGSIEISGRDCRLQNEVQVR